MDSGAVLAKNASFWATTRIPTMHQVAAANRHPLGIPRSHSVPVSPSIQAISCKGVMGFTSCRWRWANGWEGMLAPGQRWGFEHGQVKVEKLYLDRAARIYE